MRLRFQCHLSTAWLMMIASAVMVWQNTRKTLKESERHVYCFMPETKTVPKPGGGYNEVPLPCSDSEIVETYVTGFPYSFQTTTRTLWHWVFVPNAPEGVLKEFSSETTFRASHLICDIAFLAAVCF